MWRIFKNAAFRVKVMEEASPEKSRTARVFTLLIQIISFNFAH